MTQDLPFARRTGWALTPNPLALQLSDLKREGSDLLDLTESNPTRCGFDLPYEKIIQALAKDENRYYNPSPNGRRRARRAIANYYRQRRITVDPEEIYLTSSSSEAYSFLFRLLINPGEHVLFPRPSYPLFEFLVNLNDVHMDTYPLVYENKFDREGWSIDFKALEEAIHPKTKAIVVVNPNNPTGSFLTETELDMLNIICKKWNILLISDEVFLDYKLQVPDSEYTTLLGNSDVLTFVIGGLSKSLALPQMKLSWIAASGPKQLLMPATQRLEIILDTFLSVNTPAQNALEEWLAFQPEIHRQIMGRLRGNLELLRGAFKNVSDAEVLFIEGGWYAIVLLPPVRSEEEWVMDLLGKDGVFVHPGYFFDMDAEPYIVISLLTAEDILQKGIEKIIQRIEVARTGAV